MRSEALGLLAVVAGAAAGAMLPVDSRLPGKKDDPVRLMAEDVKESAVFSRLTEKRRRNEASKASLNELPQMIDVVTLGLYAGLSFDASLELYCSGRRSDLSDALEKAMLSWRIGASSREEALERAAQDLSNDALGRFGSAVCEAIAFGSPLASTLEQQAQAIRDEQRSRMEEEIERVPVKMLIPMGTLIVPAMLLAILGPLLGSALILG